MYRAMLNISLRIHQRENQWIYKPMLATGYLKKRSTPDCGVIPISSSLRHSTAHCLFGVLYYVYVTAAVIVLVNAPFTFISKLLGRNCSRFSHLRSKKKLKGKTSWNKTESYCGHCNKKLFIFFQASSVSPSFASYPYGNKLIDIFNKTLWAPKCGSIGCKDTRRAAGWNVMNEWFSPYRIKFFFHWFPRIPIFTKF